MYVVAFCHFNKRIGLGLLYINNITSIVLLSMSFVAHHKCTAQMNVSFACNVLIKCWSHFNLHTCNCLSLAYILQLIMSIVDRYTYDKANHELLTIPASVLFVIQYRLIKNLRILFYLLLLKPPSSLTPLLFLNLYTQYTGSKINQRIEYKILSLRL